jgi:hypothetical protein
LSDEQIRGWARFPGRREVFPNPGLLETERVKPLQIIQIPLMATTDTPLRWMRRHEKCAKLQEVLLI